MDNAHACKYWDYENHLMHRQHTAVSGVPSEMVKADLTWKPCGGKTDYDHKISVLISHSALTPLSHK